MFNVVPLVIQHPLARADQKAWLIFAMRLEAYYGMLSRSHSGAMTRDEWEDHVHKLRRSRT